MNHRRSRGGYHSRLAARHVGPVLPGRLRTCRLAPVRRAPVAPSRSPGEPWRPERTAVVAQVNQARAEVGLARSPTTRLLERVGDAHCGILIEEGGRRALLAQRGAAVPALPARRGARLSPGERRQLLELRARSPPPRSARILARSVEDMLAEVPPDDGHRRALLDPGVTHIGVGLAVRGGEVRMTHELATEVAAEWSPPPAVAAPSERRRAQPARLARPWRPAAVRGALGGVAAAALGRCSANAIRAYGYPPRRATLRREPAAGPAGSAGGHGSAGRRRRSRWTGSGSSASSGPPARTRGSRSSCSSAHAGAPARQLVPVAASATVVTAAGALPSELGVLAHAGRAGLPRP